MSSPSILLYFWHQICSGASLAFPRLPPSGSSHSLLRPQTPALSAPQEAARRWEQVCWWVRPPLLCLPSRGEKQHPKASVHQGERRGWHWISHRLCTQVIWAQITLLVVNVPIQQNINWCCSEATVRRGKTVVWMVIGFATVSLTLVLTIAIIAQVSFTSLKKSLIILCSALLMFCMPGGGVAIKVENFCFSSYWVGGGWWRMWSTKGLLCLRGGRSGCSKTANHLFHIEQRRDRGLNRKIKWKLGK